MAGYYEADTLSWVCAGAPYAEAFVDVGAHVGLYSVAIGTAVLGLQISSAEPVPQNAAYLRSNLALNGLDYAEVNEAAVSNASNVAKFFVNPLQDGGGSLRRPDAYRTGNRMVETESHLTEHPDFSPVIEVQTATLDSLIGER